MKPFNRDTAIPLSKLGLSRRGFLQASAVVIAAASRPGMSFASSPAPFAPERTLGLYNTHTGEQSSTVYWADGAYQSEGLSEIYYLLRDHRSAETNAMLSKEGSGVAKHSLHMDRFAIDIRVPGRNLADLRASSGGRPIT
jgi:uncharacterized protein YcbK (DUF882 family)